jgi:DNA-binding transcriptional LysR family regulator
MLQNLAYEMSVLAKAVEHKNLSAAAVHIGLSQPQLSRLIAKIESELNVVLLDRSAKRKSSWTAVAEELAVTFSKGLSRLEVDLLKIAQDREQNELHIGTLEGLASIALQFVQLCFSELKMKAVYLDILDFKDLDSQFIGGNLDLIFTVRPPTKQKYQHLIEVGYQQNEKVSSSKDVYVCSPFELTGDKKNELNHPHLFVSNSLSLRRQWLKEVGGTGSLPTDTHKGKGKGYYSVLLIGSDLISEKLWKRIVEIAEK